MKRYYAAVFLGALAFLGLPCQAQLLQKLEQGLLGGQGQGQQQGMVPGQQQGMMSGQQQGMMSGQQAQPPVVGNVNLPAGQYTMTNMQTGQAFYVVVQNGQMFLTGQQATPQMMAPGQGMMQQQQQQGGMGGLMRGGGLGNFLKNQLAPQQGPGQ